MFLRALGIAETDDEILSLLGDSDVVRNTLERDTATTREDALLEIYRRQRPGEPPTVDSARSLIDGLYFNEQRYETSPAWAATRSTRSSGSTWSSPPARSTQEDIIESLRYLLALPRRRHHQAPR